jgi:tRNA (cmo5U34)-methyltransferase
VSGQFHFDPTTYRALMAEEVPEYERLQDEAAAASAAVAPARRVLELGTGTGETALRVLKVHPGAQLVGVDVSEAMLGHARAALPDAELRIARIEDTLPDGPFELVVSVLAVHHLDGLGKADLFHRVAAVLAPGGRFVLGDVVVPEDPADAITPLSPDYDLPSSAAEQIGWLQEAGLQTAVTWAARDLAVITADRLPR